MIIKIEVSDIFKNDKLNNYLLKKDLLINESILNYGIILYENQSDVLKNISINNEINKNIDEVNNLNQQINNLKNDINFNKKKYDEIINKIQNDKDKEFENISNQKKEFEKKIKDEYYKKETEFDKIINKIENDKINQRDNYLKNINDIENKIKQQYENKIKDLENNINKLKNDKTLEITSLIEKGKQITKDDYDKIIDLHKTLNNENKNNFEKQIQILNDKNNNLNDKNDFLNKTIQDLNNKIIDSYKITENYKFDSINGNIDQLNNKVSNYFEKIFKGNTEKGNFGEKFITNFLIDKFSNSKIIDTHKETSKGDIHFFFDKLKTLIESKNVQILKKEDIDKFYKDIEIGVSKNEINSALLISLNDTNLINGKRHFFFEIKYNIPIIMISNSFDNVEFIRFSIIILNYLIKNGFTNNESDDDKLFFIINSLNELFNYFKIQLSYLNSDKQFIYKLEESFLKREKDLYNIEKLFKNILSKYPDITNIQSSNYEDNDNNFNHIINKIKDKINKEPNFIINIKNLQNLDIPINIIKKNGGIKKLIDIIKNN